MNRFGESRVLLILAIAVLLTVGSCVAEKAWGAPVEDVLKGK